MRSLLESVTRRARQRPDDIALSDGEQAISYAALWQCVEELTTKMAVLYAGPGTIGLCLDNSLAWVALDLALTRLGRPIVALPVFFTEAQRQHALDDTGAKTFITDRPLSDRACFGTVTIFGQELYLHDREVPPVVLPPETAKITYTSGTTGRPRGVCLSQFGLERVANALVDVIGSDYAGIHCAVLPLAVLLENVAGLYPTLLAGGHYHVPPPASLGLQKPFMPDFPTLVRALRDCNATSAILVPEILRGVLAVLETGSIRLPEMKLIAVGGSKVSKSLLVQAAALQVPVFQGYGLSEMASVVALNTPRNNRPGSVGQPLPHMKLELAADGEILIGHPAFLGYVGAEAAPILLATGDIGRLDEAGHLYIEGRKSNLLITSFGRNVAPEWVESELLSQRHIGQAIVFGDSVPELGALVVPSSVNVTDADVAGAIARANETLPEYAQIGHWALVPPFTITNRQLTDNGRMRRPVIHADHQAVMARCLSQAGRYESFFETLVRDTAHERAQLQETPQIRDGLSGQISRETYLHYLAEAYHHVKHTVRLMKLTESRLTPDETLLRTALAQYMEDEAGHEEWILSDIANAGGDAEAVRQGAPRLATQRMVAYAYGYITLNNPAGFFGMVFVLEDTSTQLATQGANALMRSLDLPKDCFSYLLSHGALDIDHMRFFQNLMNRIDDAHDQAAIIDMAKTMFHLFADVFRSIPHKMDNSYVN